MSTDPHPRAQLSAYLDDALSAVERSAVDAHLDTCADCRRRLAELRATASLIRALPDLVPSRRLVPRIATVPVWLAPLRTLTTLASGVSVFLFIASALLANMGQVTSTTAFSAPAAAPAGGAAASTAESTNESTAQRSNLGAGAPSVTPAPPADSVKAAPSPGGPQGPASQFNVASTSPQDASTRSGTSANDSAQRDTAHASTPAPQLGPSPWLWLALAVGLGAAALALQRRLRSA